MGPDQDTARAFRLEAPPTSQAQSGRCRRTARTGEKNAAKILDALERSKTYPLARWLYALGIPNVGEATAFYVGKWHLDFQDLATSQLLKLVVEEDNLRATRTHDGTVEDNDKSTLLSQRRSIWILIRQEIDRRSLYDMNLMSEVKKERTRIAHEIDLLVAERDELERQAELHKYEQKQKAAVHKQEQKLKPMSEREKFHKENLPQQLQTRRSKVKQRLEVLEERLQKSGMPEEVGPVVAGSILDFFESKTGKRITSQLRELGIWPQGGLASKTAPKKSGLSGKTFVLTGALPTLSREEASQMIREAGGSVASSVSKNTDYVLAGENAGSKLDKARELGVAILSETEFFEMIRATPEAAQPRTHDPVQGSLL